MERLPKNLIMEILSLLPAKEVVRLRCLSKSINDLSTKDLDLSVLQSSRVTNHCGVFVKNDLLESLDFFVTDGDTSAGVPKDAEILDRSKCNSILGCTNGLVVTSTAGGLLSNFNLCITNPVTGARCTVPFPTDVAAPFAFDTGAVVVFEKGPNGYTSTYFQLICMTQAMKWPPDPWALNPELLMGYHVYNSMRGGWTKKDIEIGKLPLNYNRPILLGETIYLATKKGFTTNYVVAVDIENQTATKLPLPPLEDSWFSPAEFGDVVGIAEYWGDKRTPSLCLVRWCGKESKMFKIWVVEDLENWTWSESCTVVTKWEMGLQDDETVESFTMINGETLVFTVVGDSKFDDNLVAPIPGSLLRQMNRVRYDVHRQIRAYGLKDGIRRQYEGTWSTGPLAFVPYSNTLHPC